MPLFVHIFHFADWAIFLHKKAISLLPLTSQMRVWLVISSFYTQLWTKPKKWWSSKAYLTTSLFLPIFETTPKHAVLFFFNDLKIQFTRISIKSIQHDTDGTRSSFCIFAVTWRFLNFKMASRRNFSGLGFIAAVIILVLTYLQRKCFPMPSSFAKHHTAFTCNCMMQKHTLCHFYLRCKTVIMKTNFFVWIWEFIVW